MLHQGLEERPSMALDKVRPRGPTSNNRQDTFSKVEWMHENPSRLPLVRRVPTLNMMHQSPEVPSGEKESSMETVRERVPVSASSSTKSSSEDSDFDDSGHNSLPAQFHNVPAFHMDTSDNTIHFSLDVADDIEGHLEEVSRLKRWGHFKEAIEYFEATLKHHLDLPLVVLEYVDLLVDQGSYQEFDSFISDLSDRRWGRSSLGQKTKCLPIGSEEKGPNLYELHSHILALRGKFSYVSLAVDELGLIQTDSFCEYLDKRAASRHGANHPHGIWLPFDSTEVQIIRNQLELRSDIRCKGKTEISAFDTRCWPELYNDLLMDGRIWELSDLLLAMFRFFGLSGTWDRLFDLDEKKKKSQKSHTIHCLERLLKDWTIDEYDEATELAILTILVEMMYMLDIGSQSLSLLHKDRTLTLARCAQQAEQCAVDIKQYSPHLMNSRPYLQWILAKEHFDRQQNRSSSYREQRKQWIEGVPGLVLNKWCLPIYIPVVTENPGWPAPDPKFPPSESLQWALKISKELSDYKTQTMLLEELICRVEDPRPFFNELDQLHGHAQGDLVQFYESLTSQYLLASDNASCQELLQRLKAAAGEFKPAPKDDVCVATHWNGLRVQNALARSISENEELVEQNSDLAKTISHGLPYSQKAIDKFAKPTVDGNETNNGNGNSNGHADRSKETAPLTQASPEEQQFEESKYLIGSSRVLIPHEVRGKPNESFKEDIVHRLHKLELDWLKHKRQALEKELHDARSRRELEEFEYEERLRARKEETRKKEREEAANSGLRFYNDAPSRGPDDLYNEKDEPIGEQGDKDGHKVEFRQPEDVPTEDTIPLTHEPEEINYDTPAHEKKDPQTPEDPYRYVSVAEPQDEPTTLEEPDQDTAEPGLSENRSCQRPSPQVEPTQPRGTSKLTDHVVVAESIGEDSLNPSEAMVNVREETLSGDQRPSRDSSLGRSSKRDSQESGDRRPRMIGYSEEIID